MLKKPVLVFTGIMCGLALGASLYVRSLHFAGIVKRFAFARVPAEWGLQADFARLSIGVFPPTLSVHEPTVRLRERNLTNLPADSVIRARRIDLAFRPFQSFSKRIRVDEVAIVGGEISLDLDRAFLREQRARAKPKGGGAVGWGDLAQIDIEAVRLLDSRVSLKLADPAVSVRLAADRLELSRWERAGQRGYAASFDLREVEGSYPKAWGIPARIAGLSATARVDPRGMDVGELRVSLDGASLESRGRLTGDLLGGGALSAEASLRLRGEAGRIAAAFAPGTPETAVSGQVDFEGKVRANPARLLETLRAEGRLNGRELRLRDWNVDELSLDGTWSAGGSGGEIALKRGLIRTEPTARGPGRTGGGGRIEIGEFRWRPGGAERLQVPLTLTDAHVHWLAAPASREIFPLDLRASGKVGLEIEPPAGRRPGALLARVDLKVPRFTLDNQKLERARPLSKVLDIRDISLTGGVRVDAEAVRLQGVQVGTGRTRLDVGGEIHFRDGFNLRASGPVNLADVGTIAENEIRGVGRLEAHVHGPGKAVTLDFDADLQDAYYLKLALGEAKGRVTWEDGPGRLRLTGLRLNRGRTPYRAEGRVELGPGSGDEIDLTVEFPQGQLSDFLPIFNDLTGELSWFPRSLIGNFSAAIRVTGSANLDRLQVLGRMEGTDWDYLGEGFRSVALTGGYDRGDYVLESARAIKQQGRLRGRIRYDREERFDWELLTENFSVSDLDLLARLNVPVRGRLGLVSRGRGRLGGIEAVTQASLTEASVRGVAVAPSEIAVRNSGGVLSINGQAMGGQGVLDASYDFRPGAASHVRAELNGLDFSAILLLLNPRSIQDPELRGVVSGAVDLAFRTGELEYATGAVELREYVLARQGSRFSLAAPVGTRVERGSFRLENLALRGPTGEVRGAIGSRGSQLSGKLEGEADLSLLEFFTPVIARAGGRARIDVDVGGTLKAPLVLGRATMREASLRLEGFESPFENVAGTVELRQNVLTVPRLEADLANGRIEAGGTVTLFADRVPALNLKGTLAGNRLKVYPFQFVRVRGDLRAHGDSIPYVVDGNLEIESALSRERMASGGQMVGLKSARFLPPPTATRTGDFPLFKLNIRAEAQRGVLVQNDVFDAELKGRLTIVNTLEAPRVLGKAEMVQGRIAFKDRVFNVQSANVSFDNPTVMNPLFNLTANTDLNGTRVQIYAAGRMDDYRIELSSNPVMPESEILALLATGFPATDAGNRRPVNANSRGMIEQGQAGIEQSQAASLLLQTLDFNREIQSRTGFEIRLDEEIDETQGASVQRPRAETEVAGATRIVLRRRIGKRLNFTFGSTVGSSGNAQQEVNTEVRLTPGMSVIGVWEGNVNGADQTTRTNSWGLDLRLQRRFK